MKYMVPILGKFGHLLLIFYIRLWQIEKKTYKLKWNVIFFCATNSILQTHIEVYFLFLFLYFLTNAIKLHASPCVGLFICFIFTTHKKGYKENAKHLKDVGYIFFNISIISTKKPVYILRSLGCILNNERYKKAFWEIILYTE